MIRFLVLHGLDNLLARNHMTENHMDAENRQKYSRYVDLCPEKHIEGIVH